jgi:hypothetical protein
MEGHALKITVDWKQDLSGTAVRLLSAETGTLNLCNLEETVPNIAFQKQLNLLWKIISS